MLRPDLNKLPSYVPGARDASAIKLSSNEAAHPPLPAAAEEMALAAKQANRYPDMGVTELRQALAQHLGLGFDQVAVGNGSSALCQQLVQITCQPGDEVVFPWRSFEAYPIFAHVVGADPVAVPLTDDHRVDLRAMARAVTDKTRLIFVCNPNNPTGTAITTNEFREFMQQIPDNVVVGLDEAYFEYNQAGSTPVGTEVVHEYGNVIALRTFSKAYGLAGVRVGYAFGPAALIDALLKVAIPFSVNAVGQKGALASLKAQNELNERVQEVIAERELVQHALRGFGAAESQANFVWLPAENLLSTLEATPQDIAQRLSKDGVLVRAFAEGIRITVTTAEEREELLSAWRRISA